MRAVAAIDEVGVAIDEAGGDEAALAIDAMHAGRCLGAGADPGDPAILDEDRRIFDQAIVVAHGGGVEIGQEHLKIHLYKVVYTV